MTNNVMDVVHFTLASSALCPTGRKDRLDRDADQRAQLWAAAMASYLAGDEHAHDLLDALASLGGIKIEDRVRKVTDATRPGKEPEQSKRKQTVPKVPSDLRRAAFKRIRRSGR